MPSTDPTEAQRAADPLVEEVRAFVCAPPSTNEEFDALASRVLVRQLRHYPTYGELAASRGLSDDALERGAVPWTAAPPMPSAAFAHLPLRIGQPEQTFRSSGTTRDGASRSEHQHTNLDLYRTIVDRSFPDAVFSEPDPEPRSRTVLSLVPPPSLVDDSSLGFMIDHAMKRWADERSQWAFDDHQLVPSKAVDWLQTVAAHADRPVVLGTALALWAVLDAAAGGSRPSPWPAALRLMETGGFKTERFRLTREQLLRRLREEAGVTTDRVVREYGMTELTSQAYSDPLRAPNLFGLPHWTRVRALDPETLEDVEVGAPGLLAFLDLGNVGSAAFVLTEDIGRLADGEPTVGRRFELLGRARDAQLRGCSLTTEQLLES